MKFPKRMSFFLITSALALGVGLTLSINNKIDVNAAETLTYSTGFEASEGFSVSTVYNNSEPRLQGPSGQQWGTIMGISRFLFCKFNESFLLYKSIHIR